MLNVLVESGFSDVAVAVDRAHDTALLAGGVPHAKVIIATFRPLFVETVGRK